MKPISAEDIDAMMDEWEQEMEQISKKMGEALTPAEFRQCEGRLKVYRDLFNVVNTAEGKGYAKGKAEGIMENILEMAVQMKMEGLDSSLISKITGLSIEEINQL